MCTSGATTIIQRCTTGVTTDGCPANDYFNMWGAGIGFGVNADAGARPRIGDRVARGIATSTYPASPVLADAVNRVLWLSEPQIR